MSELKVSQLQFESNGWKRTLVFMNEENIHYKNRVAEILKKNFNTELLGSLEGFLAKFLHEDARIALLRNDVAEFDEMLIREVIKDGQPGNHVTRKMKRINNNLIAAEKAFCHLKSTFNNCLAGSPS